MGEAKRTGPADFRLEARYQRCCVVPDCAAIGPHHAHHGVYVQVLRRAGIRGNDLYDPRNAVRLCMRCHERHHTRTRVLRTTWLPTPVIVYAFEILQLQAGDYLRRTYDDYERDDRIVEEEDMIRGW